MAWRSGRIREVEKHGILAEVVLPGQRVVSTPSVEEHHRAGGHYVAHERHQAGPRGVGGLDLHGDHHQGFCGPPAPSSAVFDTDPGLVDIHVAGERLPLGPHHGHPESVPHALRPPGSRPRSWAPTLWPTSRSWPW